MSQACKIDDLRHGKKYSGCDLTPQFKKKKFKKIQIKKFRGKTLEKISENSAKIQAKTSLNNQDFS